MSESIQKFISTIREVSEYLPRFSSDDIISNHVGWWFGYGSSGDDFRLGHKFSSDARGNNAFLKDFLSDDYSISRPLMYLIVIPQNSKYEKNIVRVINDDIVNNITTPELVSRSGMNGMTLSKSTYGDFCYNGDNDGYLKITKHNAKYNYLKIDLCNNMVPKYYVLFDDLNLSALKLLKSKNLDSNIIAVSCSMHELRGSGFFGGGNIATYIKNELGLDKSIRINGDDIDDSVKLTKVMSKLISEHGYTDEDWEAKIDRIEKYGGCRISFQFNNKSKDATKFLMNEFEKNGVVPLRLKWSRGHVDTIVGGIVMCPEENKNKI